MKKYIMPAEWEKHEGTWLVWPQKYGNWGPEFVEEVEPIWIAMTKALHTGERVHIVAYNNEEKENIIKKLEQAEVDIKQIDFYIVPTNDVWVRDSGPIFVYDQDDNLLMTNWNFNGWGEKYKYDLDALLPDKLSGLCNIPIISTKVCLEGGGIEVNGSGTLIATRTSVLNDSRNPQKSQVEVEKELHDYLGIEKTIWLKGVLGEENHGEDTDFHIDGSAKFVDENTVMYSIEAFGTEIADDEKLMIKVWELQKEELLAATDKNNQILKLIPLPITKKILPEVGFRGIYMNFYIGNEVVLQPVFGDENDKLAIEIVQTAFRDKKVVPINCTKLWKYGGMVHCVTQQQPVFKKR